MNNQKPEAAAKGDGMTLDFHSMFFTIQGEGPFSGHRSIFVRLAGCNLQCPGCDTEYTEGREIWKARHIALAIKDLAEQHNAHGCLVVITGGEPLRQTIGKLCQMLINAGYFIQIESNGVFEPDSDVQEFATLNQLALIVSPKTSRIHSRTAELATAFKYVLDYRSVDPVDGLPIKALEHPAAKGVARPRPGAPVYLNPFDSGDKEHNTKNLQAAAESCKAHGYVLGVQLHKLVGLE